MKYRSKCLLLLMTISLVAVSSENIVLSATHTHSDECYTGIKHTHNSISNCHTWTRYSRQCPRCKGTGYNICETCDASGELLAPCGGTWEYYKDRNGSSYQVETPSGSIFSGSVYHVYKCNVCGAEIDHSVTGGDSYTGNSGTMYLNGFTADSDLLHRYDCTDCSGTGYLSTVCDYCNGSKVTTRTCTTCNGDYTNADCGKCVAGKVTVTGTCDASKLSMYNSGQSSWSDSTSQGTYNYYTISCMCCGRGWSVTYQVGESIGGSISKVTFTYGSVKTTYCSVIPTASNFLTYINTNIINHQVNGGNCDTCQGTGYTTCSKCSTGKQYLSTLCSKKSGVFYNSDGTVSSVICDKKIKLIIPKTKSQTIVR